MLLYEIFSHKIRKVTKMQDCEICSVVTQFEFDILFHARTQSLAKTQRVILLYSWLFLYVLA